MKSAGVFRIINEVSDRLVLRIAGLIFALVSLAHVTRVIGGVEVEIGGRTIPMWPSVAGAVVAGALSIWMWRISQRMPRL